MDSAHFAATTGQNGEYEGAGPLTNITFGLYVPEGGAGGEGLGPLPPLKPTENDGGGLTPLPPLKPASNDSGGLTPLQPLKPMPAQAQGKGTMYWNASTVKSQFSVPGAYGIPWDPETLEIEVIIYANGNGVVKLNHRGGLLYFKARLSKSVALMDVK